MTSGEIKARFHRWPGLTLSGLLLVFSLLWIDSMTHSRRFLFFPAGDVAAGFRSFSGSLQWIEFAYWEDRPAGRDYVIASAPYWLFVGIFAASLCWYILRKTKLEETGTTNRSPA
jgi:hypothetical protein